jgi:hypothetical protein
MGKCIFTCIKNILDCVKNIPQFDEMGVSEDIYLCQHAKKNKRFTADSSKPRARNKECRASIDILIKKSLRSDPFTNQKPKAVIKLVPIIVFWCTVVKVTIRHDHFVECILNSKFSEHLDSFHSCGMPATSNVRHRLLIYGTL